MEFPHARRPFVAQTALARVKRLATLVRMISQIITFEESSYALASAPIKRRRPRRTAADDTINRSVFPVGPFVLEIKWRRLVFTQPPIPVPHLKAVTACTTGKTASTEKLSTEFPTSFRPFTTVP